MSSLPPSLLTPEEQAMRARAEKATPGPWSATDDLETNKVVDAQGASLALLMQTHLRGRRAPGEAAANASYIAAANPQRILALLAELETARGALRDNRQAAVEAFIRRVWSDAAMDRGERARRLLEEAIELAQAEGVERGEIGRFADFIYARPAGGGEQEAAGVGITLLGYAAACGFSADRAEEAELQRLLSKPDDHWRKRQRVKADAGMSAALGGQAE